MNHIYLLLLFIWIGMLPLAAQQRLSLDRAIELGLKNNFEIKLAKLQASTDQVNKRIGADGQFPQVGFKLRQSNLFSLDNSPTSFTDGGYSKAELTGGVDLDWVIFDGFQVRINKKRLDKLEKQSMGISQLLVENTLQAIILAYYKALIEQEKLRVVDVVRHFSLEKYKKGKEELAYGDISKYELYNFENALLEDSIYYYEQNLAYSQALIQLNYLIGVKHNDQLVLTDQLQFENRKYDFSRLRHRLMVNNQDIKNQYLNISLKKNAIRRFQAQKKPSISFQTGLSEEISTSKFTGDERENGGLFDYYVNFTLSYRLFDGKQLNGKIEVAAIEEQIANGELDKLKTELTERLQLSFDNYERQQDILKLRKRLINKLSENLLIAQDRFENGYSLYIEYRDLQIKLLEAELNRLETVFELKVAETEMIRLIGGITKKN